MKTKNRKLLAMAVVFLGIHFSANAQNSYPANDDAKINDQYTIHLGYNLSGKHPDAGKIGYRKFSTDALDIVGAGTSSSNRRIKFYAEGGSIFTGSIGIGNVSPSTALDLRATYSGNIAKFYSTINSNSWITIGNNNNSNTLNVGVGSATVGGYLWSNTGKVFFGADGNPTMLVDHTLKKVGLGILPGEEIEADLHVMGTNNASIMAGMPINAPGGRSRIFMAVANCNGCWGNFIKDKDVVLTSGFNSVGDLAIQVLGTNRSILFGTSNNNTSVERMRLTNGGSLLINTTCAPSDGKLAVNGKIYATAINVKLPDANGCFPDYVFEKNYPLMSLNDVETYIATNKHLPNIPSAAEVSASGIDVAEMNIKLLEKIEELTLYMIELKKENAEIKKELESIRVK